MVRYRIWLILLLICYGHFGFAWSVGSTHQDASNTCMHGGILNGVFLHGGIKSRNDTIFTQISDMQACIEKCCKIDQCDLAMKIGSVCHAVKCKDEDSCQISHSKQSSSLKAQISFITKGSEGEELKKTRPLDHRKNISPSSTNSQAQLTEEQQQPKLQKQKPRFQAETSEGSSSISTTAQENEPLFDKDDESSGKTLELASGSGESGDESETAATDTSESGLRSIDNSGYNPESSDEESSGSGDGFNLNSFSDSESSIFPKPSTGRSAIPTPRKTKVARFSDTPMALKETSAGEVGKTFSPFSEKDEDDDDDDILSGSGAGSGSQLLQGSISREENTESRKLTGVTQTSNGFQGIRADHANKLSATPIKTAVPSKHKSTNAKSGKTENEKGYNAKKSLQNNYASDYRKSSLETDLSAKTSKIGTAFHSLKSSAKHRLTKMNIKDKTTANNIQITNGIYPVESSDQGLKTFTLTKTRGRVLEDLGSEGEALGSPLPLSLPSELKGAMQGNVEAKTSVANDFKDIARGSIIEKPLENRASFKDTGPSAGTNTRQQVQKHFPNQPKKGNQKGKTVSKLQIQLSELFAKDSKHMRKYKNAQKISKAPNIASKKQKLFNKIRRIQRDRERERHYSQTLYKQRQADGGLPLSILFKKEAGRRISKYYIHHFSDWRGWKRDELLKPPEQEMNCRRGVTIRGATLKGGMLAGDFQTVGIVSDQHACVKSCCNNRRCDVALMLGKECFNVKCYTENLCGLAPATTLFDEVTPVITYVRGHVDKRSIDYDDFDEDRIIDRVKQEDEKLVRSLQKMMDE